MAYSLAIYREFWGITDPLNLFITPPLSKENVSVTDLVNCCLLQQKWGSRAEHGSHFGVEMWSLQARA